MQLVTAAPHRSHLTGDQVRRIIEASHLEVDLGVELLDADDRFLADISGDVDDGVVEHGNYRTIHGTCRLTLTRRLDWGGQRVRPYMTLTAGGLTARFDLGVYLLSTPTRSAGTAPVTYQVEGYDKLHVLDTPIGSTYRVAAGTGHLAAVVAAINAAGETKIRIASLGDDTPLPRDRVWPIAEESTWLRVVNDLLDAVGRQAVWCDDDGWYRSEPYQSPTVRAPEWLYDADDQERTTVGEDRTEEADFHATPNRWVFIRDDPEAGLPVDGDGRYQVDDVDGGVTSQQARGRVITRVVPVDTSTQAALVAKADRMVANDRQVIRSLRLTVGPNPLHAHFDVVTVRDAELGVDTRAVIRSWVLPLDGSDMTLDMREVG